MRLEDSTVVVTGGTSGLGKAMAGAFLEEGATVVLTSRSRERAESTAAGLPGPGEALGIEADVRSWDAVQRLIDETERRAGPVDVLVNNAGLTGQLVRGSTATPPVAETDPETWETILDTNLTGAFHCARAVLPRLLERDAGRLIHVSSGMGVAAKAGWGAYVASKFGLEGLAETIAKEVADTGVDSLLFRPPGGGVFTEAREAIGRGPEDSAHRADVVAEPAVQLAAGAGENGGRYVATPDGEGFEPYSKGGR